MGVWDTRSLPTEPNKRVAPCRLSVVFFAGPQFCPGTIDLNKTEAYTRHIQGVWTILTLWDKIAEKQPHHLVMGVSEQARCLHISMQPTIRKLAPHIDPRLENGGPPWFEGEQKMFLSFMHHKK